MTRWEAFMAKKMGNILQYKNKSYMLSGSILRRYKIGRLFLIIFMFLGMCSGIIFRDPLEFLPILVLFIVCGSLINYLVLPKRL